MLTRRRFLAVTAAMGASPGFAKPATLHVETGLALGAQVTLRLSHEDAPRIAALAMSEIRRLEQIFSLYQPMSALSRLNAHASLDSPPPELLDCLSLAQTVNQASGGLFDPSVQPLWHAHAISASRGQNLSPVARLKLLDVTGLEHLHLDSYQITMKPGMALTLNGIAQGYIADKVAALLSGHGLTNALIDTGEMVALGGQPATGAPWPVKLAQGGQVNLRFRAIATSSPLGMTMGADGCTAHILDPRSGLPAPLRWRGISISSASAALADAISTAACLAEDRAQIEGLCAAFADTSADSIVTI